MTTHKIELVARFDHQVTGVSVSEDNRIFVNFPRWTEDNAVSVAELTADGSLRPYPDQEWNAWRNARKDEVSPNDHWVCVQSVVADGRGSLWVLDPAAPAQAHLVSGGAKLVQVDLANDKVVRTIAFDEDTAPQGSYLNDVRFSNDGNYAYITDSGVVGAILVVDLANDKTARLLDGHPSTQMKKGLNVKADGQVLRRPDGRGVEFSADGIELSGDGAWLYWQAIKGDTLYRIPTQVLIERGLKGGDVGDAVEEYGHNGVNDGLLFDRGSNRLFLTSVQDDAIKMRDLDAGPQAEVRMVVQDPRLRWPDTFTQGPDGTIYVTTSHIQDSSFFKPDAPAALPSCGSLLNQIGNDLPAVRLAGRDHGLGHARTVGVHGAVLDHDVVGFRRAGKRAGMARVGQGARCEFAQRRAGRRQHAAPLLGGDGGAKHRAGAAPGLGCLARVGEREPVPGGGHPRLAVFGFLRMHGGDGQREHHGEGDRCELFHGGLRVERIERRQHSASRRRTISHNCARQGSVTPQSLLSPPHRTC
ncbi:sugar lactone lactonase YvrE [Massilia sp. UYP11]